MADDGKKILTDSLGNSAQETPVGAGQERGWIRQLGSLLGHGLFERRPALPTLVIGVIAEVAVIFAIDRLESTSNYLGLPGAFAALVGVVAALAGGPAVGLGVSFAGGLAYFAFITDFGTTVVWPAIVGSFVLWMLAAGLAGLAGDWIRGRAADREAVLNRSLMERQKLLNTLSESEERFRTTANAIPQLAWLARADGFIYWYNDRWYEYTGTTPAQMEGWGWQSVHDPNELPKVLELWKRSIATGEPFEMEFPLRGADGVYRLFLTRVMPIKNERGQVVQWVGTNTDVSESARLRAELARELRTTQILLQTADALAEWTDLEQVLQGLTRAVVSATGHSRASFALFDEEKREVRFVASIGEEPIPALAATPEEFSPQYRTMAASLTPVVADYDAMPDELKRIAASVNARKGLWVPLTYRHRLVGGLFVDSPGRRGEFPDEEIRLIEGIASQAAVAVENARLYEAQSNIAATLQQALLHLPPEVPGVRFSHLYRSATETAAVGGDFYDMIRLKGDGYILLIGDVSGHGVEAARSATFVKDAAEAFASEGKDPQEILGDINEALLRRGLSGFVTLLLATLSPDRRSISFCSAGHPHALVRRRDGEVAFAGMAHHAPLGVFTQWWCDVERLPLFPGDLLLFYTDGVIEARSGGELFGERRLMEWVARRTDVTLPDLPSTLLAEVLAFSGGTLRDDVAIVAVEIEG